jgi:nitrite reductase/ring-hydroxylating ferredoxin subunit
MPLVRVADLSALPPGAVLEYMYGEMPVAVCNDAGSIHALHGRCPHHNGPLGQGNLAGGHIVCPWHAWEFSCATGELDYNPAIRVATFPLELRDGGVFVELP